MNTLNIGTVATTTLAVVFNPGCTLESPGEHKQQCLGPRTELLMYLVWGGHGTIKMLQVMLICLRVANHWS